MLILQLVEQNSHFSSPGQTRSPAVVLGCCARLSHAPRVLRASPRASTCKTLQILKSAVTCSYRQCHPCPTRVSRPFVSAPVHRSTLHPPPGADGSTNRALTTSTSSTTILWGTLIAGTNSRATPHAGAAVSAPHFAASQFLAPPHQQPTARFTALGSLRYVAKHFSTRLRTVGLKFRPVLQD